MRFVPARRLIRSLGFTGLCSVGFAQTVYAQVPQAAAGSVSVGTSEPALFQAQTPVLTPQGGAADSSDSDDFLHRYKPQDNLWEVGVFVGPLFISDNNSFRGATIVNPGAPPTVKPISRFDQPAPELGLRAGYFPFAFLGAEVEGMVAAAQNDSDQGVTVLAARTHLVIQSPLWSIVPFVVGGVGYWNVRNETSGNDSDPAFHFGGGAKLNVTHNLAVRLDVRDTITNQRGGASYPHNVEALAGANLVFGRVPRGPKDSDHDGFSDDQDQCPLEAGTQPAGCPLRDSDSDGVMDPDDQCVSEAGVAPTGCPLLDADQDGVLDAEDQCVNDRGVAPTGCPDGDQDGVIDRDDKCLDVAGVAPDGCLADPDGDGIRGADDRCPDQAETSNGFEDGDGCPDELPSAVKSFVGVIAGIEFEMNEAKIGRGSETVLGQAVKVLNDYPSLRVEIIGHTDNRGRREFNLTLSQQRADSVKAYLVERGIDAARIQTRGDGPDVPITTNNTAAGRQKNRRIEFRVLQ